MLYDVLIIGGGPAGLAVATGLSRQLYKAVVFDSGVYRNERATHMHNVPTWDHQNPAAFRKKARDDILSRYDTINFENTKIQSVTRIGDGLFEAGGTDGQKWRGRKVAIATGVRDIFPKIDGYDECWGRGIFHCLFCHGYEDRGSPSAGILAIEDIANPHTALHLARMAKRLAKQVTIYTHGEASLADSLSAMLVDDEVVIDQRPISRLEKAPNGSEVTIHFSDGQTEPVTEGFLVHKPRTEPNGPFVEQLGLELTNAGDIKTTTPFGETSVPGVFAVGDCGTMLKAVTQAVATGSIGATGLAMQLQIPVPKEQIKPVPAAVAAAAET